MRSRGGVIKSSFRKRLALWGSSITPPLDHIPPIPGTRRVGDVPEVLRGPPCRARRHGPFLNSNPNALYNTFKILNNNLKTLNHDFETDFDGRGLRGLGG